MNEERIDELTAGYLSDRLTDDEKSELASWLDEESAHRAVFREAVELEYALATKLGGRTTTAEPDDLLAAEKKVVPISVRLQKWEHVGVAALLMISLTLGWILWSERGRPTEGVAGTSDSFAKLSRVDSDVVFHEDHELPRQEGSYLGKGWVLLDRGTVEIEFHSGAQVEVTGPAVFGIDTAMRGFLESGEVSVYAPEEARDFVVGTSSMEVVDLGTRFNLSVDRDSSAAKVSVAEGLVDLHLGGAGTPRRIRQLPAGLTAQIDGSGEIVSIDGTPLAPSPDPGGLVAHWKLDEVGGDASVMDSSGNERHGVFRGDVASSSVPGRIDQALDLSAGQFVDISDHIMALTETSAFTFAAWLRDADDIVFSVSDGTPRNRVQFERQYNALLYGWQQGARFDSIQGRVDEWEEGKWYHVAVAISGAVVTIYRDGQMLNSSGFGGQISEKSMSLIDVENPSHAYIGYLIANHVQQPQRLGGQIDDVQFYRRALDARAIQFLYENPGSTWKNE